MKFDKPAGQNPIDRLKVIGKPRPRIEGPLKAAGTAVLYEHHDVAPDVAYGYVLGRAVANGRIASINVADARAVTGVLAVVTANNSGRSKAPGFTPPSRWPDLTLSIIIRPSRWWWQRRSSRHVRQPG